MDVIKKKEKKDRKVVWTIALCFVIFLIGYWLFSGPSISVNRNEILIDKVEQGTLNIQVEGYGKLRSNKQKLLTTQSDATVEEIILKPGAIVTPDSIIVRLKNPALENEVEIASQNLSYEVAKLRKQKLEQIREILASEEKLELIKADYEAAKLQKDALEGLVAAGVESRLKFSGVRLEVEQLEKRSKIIEKSVNNLRLVHLESNQIQQEAIESAKRNFEMLQQRLAQLTVRAGMDGVLQKLPVELGQSLLPGQQIALVGGTQDLVALIKVPQAQAEKVSVGLRASIDTGKESIESEVMRISPTVESGSVEVEISLANNASTQLRPDQNVDATIFIEKIDSAYFIQRPSNVAAFSTSTIYKISEDQLKVKATPVKFGVTSGRFIQIISGAGLGDSLVTSDLSYLNNIPEAGLKN